MNGVPSLEMGVVLASLVFLLGGGESVSPRVSDRIACLREERGEAAAEELRGLAERATGEGYYPAVHHSQAYREAYSPAYRAVLREMVSEELRGPLPASP